MSKKIALKQIEDLPYGNLIGSAFTFNQQYVGVCNTTTETILGTKSLGLSNNAFPVGAFATIKANGLWQPSSAINTDKLTIEFHLASAANTPAQLLFSKQITRTQVTYSEGHFYINATVSLGQTNLLTIAFEYQDNAATGNRVAQTYEFNSENYTAYHSIYMVIKGQCASPLGLLNLNNFSNTNRVYNPSFDAPFVPVPGFNNWETDQYAEQTVFQDYFNFRTVEACCNFQPDPVRLTYDSSTITPLLGNNGYILQAGVFQTGKLYKVEFWHKNDDQFVFQLANASYSLPINFPDINESNSNSYSILTCYAAQKTNLPDPKDTTKNLVLKGPLIGAAITGKEYTKSTFYTLGLLNFDCIYFEIVPLSQRSLMAIFPMDIINSFLQGNGIDPGQIDSGNPSIRDYLSTATLQTSVLYQSCFLDDVGVYEATLPINLNTKEIRLRQFSAHYTI